jgi:NTE family protein
MQEAADGDRRRQGKKTMHRAKIGLALGSGAARGWAHIGVIEALEEAGVAIDVVCGSSIGALVGAAFVAGKMKELKEWALGLTRRRMVSMLDIRFRGGGLVNGGTIMRQLRALGLDQPIEKCEIPFAAVAAELTTGHEVWIREGAIDEAIRGSIALPGILSPARHDGRWLLDGGLVNPVPVSACRALGAEVIIGVNLNADFFESRGSATAALRARRLHEETSHHAGDEPKPSPAEIALRLLRPTRSAPGYFEVLTMAVNIMQDQITRARLAGEPPQVLLIPRLGGIAPMDFHRAAEAIERGRASVAHALHALRQAANLPSDP